MTPRDSKTTDETIARLEKALAESLSELKNLAVVAQDAPTAYEKEEIMVEMRELGERISESTEIIEKVFKDLYGSKNTE